jgi:hypothetical protein
MKSFQVKLWDNSCVFSRAVTGGFIETLYVRASTIDQALSKARAHARKQGYTSNRIVDVVEIEETIVS